MQIRDTLDLIYIYAKMICVILRHYYEY